MRRNARPSNLTCDGSVRRIEPYSLHQTAEGNFVLHVIRSDSGKHRSYRVDRMQDATVTRQSFAPRYLVELPAEGPLPVARSIVSPGSIEIPARQTRPAPRTQAFAPARSTSSTCVYRCTVCGKTFNRKTMDGTLNPHKSAKTGYDCPGTYGTLVKTKQ